MARPVKIEPWLEEACNLMVRTDCGLFDVCMTLGIEITLPECNTIARRPSFQRLLWQTRHRYFQELGSDPNFTKDTAIGKLLNLAQKLELEGENDKAAEVYFKIAKMTGWVGPESTISVFGELSQKDLDAIRHKVEKETKPRVN